FGDDEQGDAFGALGSIRQAGQHDMHDVFGQVVVAGGNKDLGSGDFIGTIGLGDGTGFDLAQVGAALGLGQAHGAGPAAFGQGNQVCLFLLFAAVQQDGVHG